MGDRIAPKPPVPPIIMQAKEVKAFADRVEYDMKSIKIMIDSLIEYNAECKKASDKLARGLKKANLVDVRKEEKK